MLAVVALTPNRMYTSLRAALRRQSDPNWHAFFIRLDETPSDEAIDAVLGTLSDPRLQLLRPALGANSTVRATWWVISLCKSTRHARVLLLSVFACICVRLARALRDKVVPVATEVLTCDSNFLLQYSIKDAGSAATDQALKAAMQKKECTWISVTSSDNAYGSKVRALGSVLTMPYFSAS
jgi:hypothetical protein